MCDYWMGGSRFYYSWRKTNCAESKLRSLCIIGDSSVVWNCEESNGRKNNYICSKRRTGTEMRWHVVEIPYNYKLEDWSKIKEESINPKAIYGENLVDERDGNVYKTVFVGGKWWMAENLRYLDSIQSLNLKNNVWCYANSSRNCEIGGAYYTWTAAMDVDDKWSQENLAQSLISTPHQGICPKGWHIPTLEEWEFSRLGFCNDDDCHSLSNDDLDTNGLALLHIGSCNIDWCDGRDGSVGSSDCFWIANEQSDGTWAWCMGYNSYTGDGVPVRCVKDDE